MGLLSPAAYAVTRRVHGGDRLAVTYGAKMSIFMPSWTTGSPPRARRSLRMAQVKPRSSARDGSPRSSAVTTPSTNQRLATDPGGLRPDRGRRRSHFESVARSSPWTWRTPRQEEQDEFLPATAIVPAAANPSTLATTTSSSFMIYACGSHTATTPAFISRFRALRPPPRTGASSLYTSDPLQCGLRRSSRPSRGSPYELFGEYIAHRGLKQLRIDELKNTLMSRFSSTAVKRVFEGKDRVLVPSLHVATHDTHTGSSTYAVTRQVRRGPSTNQTPTTSYVCRFCSCRHGGVQVTSRPPSRRIEAIDRVWGVSSGRLQSQFVTRC